jgi:hypothetical protein
MRDPSDRDRMLRCIPLLLERDGESMLMPDEGIVLREDDRILFCGSHRAGKRIGWALQNVHSLNYLRTGESRPQGWIWRLFQRGHGQDQ